MKRYTAILALVLVLATVVSSYSQQPVQPVLELTGTVLSRSASEFKIYQRVKTGLSFTHTFKVTRDTVFYGLVMPGVFVVVRYTQKMLRPGLFVRTAVEVRGYPR